MHDAWIVKYIPFSFFFCSKHDSGIRKGEHKVLIDKLLVFILLVLSDGPAFSNLGIMHGL